LLKLQRGWCDQARAREFFKDLLKSGFITQHLVQKTKNKIVDMSAFGSSGQPCYLTALHVHNAGRVSFGWLARDRLFILAGKRVPLFAC